MSKAGSCHDVWKKLGLCSTVFLSSGVFGHVPISDKDGWEKTMSVSSDSVRSQNVSDEVKPVAALTFDDGPNASSTPILLDGLKERKVRATFFLIGENVEKDENEKIVKRMYEEVSFDRKSYLYALQSVKAGNGRSKERTGTDRYSD